MPNSVGPQRVFLGGGFALQGRGPHSPRERAHYFFLRRRGLFLVARLGVFARAFDLL